VKGGEVARKVAIAIGITFVTAAAIYFAVRVLVLTLWAAASALEKKSGRCFCNEASLQRT